MTPAVNQARIRLHQKRIARGLSMTELAHLVGHPRESVSRAVNQGRYPRIIRKLKEALNG